MFEILHNQNIKISCLEGKIEEHSFLLPDVKVTEIVAKKVIFTRANK